MAIEKIKILGAVLGSYQLNCTANSAHLVHFAVNELDCQYCFAGSSKAAPRILNFSIDVDVSFELNSVET